MMNPANLARERAALRGGASFLLTVDVNQFYPSLYTHAVGWAIDLKLRVKANWQNKKLLGKALDQALMNLQGKISQGVPIGNDISFLLTEIVLAQVDRKLGVEEARSFRWFDDYEIACDSRDEAEQVLARLSRELGAFRLRINQNKTKIISLPSPSQEEWQQILREQSEADLSIAQNMVQYFDSAFRLRRTYPESPVLLYALGILFKLRCPPVSTGRVALSALTQALLAEPGAAQKAFSLLTFWQLNGFELNIPLLTQTVERMIFGHEMAGVSSDISWALAFCIENGIKLGSKASNILSTFLDDCVAIQALHAHQLGLLPKGFSTSRLARLLKTVDLDGEHWLLGYEAFRQGFLPDSGSAVKSNKLFQSLFKSKITFYRTKLPVYASVIHPGGAPEWVVQDWIRGLRKLTRARAKELKGYPYPILKLLRQDLERIPRKETSVDDAIAELLDVAEAKKSARMIAGIDAYVG